MSRRVESESLFFKSSLSRVFETTRVSHSYTCYFDYYVRVIFLSLSFFPLSLKLSHNDDVVTNKPILGFVKGNTIFPTADFEIDKSFQQ